MIVDSAVVATQRELTGFINDLDCAIAAVEQSVALTPEDHPSCCIYLDMLSVSLQSDLDKLDPSMISTI